MVANTEPDIYNTSTWKWFVRIVTIILISATIFLVSCYTEKKAINQVDKALDEYPEVAAKAIRDLFPCVDTDTTITVISVDSSEYVSQRDSALMEANKANKSKDSALSRIKSLPEAVRQACADYEVIIDAQKEENRILNRLLANVKPKIEYRDKVIKEKDMAEVFLANKERDDYKLMYEIDHDFRLKQEKKEKGNFALYIPIWLVVLLITTSGLLVYTKVKTGLFNPIKLIKK